LTVGITKQIAYSYSNEYEYTERRPHTIIEDKESSMEYLKITGIGKSFISSYKTKWPVSEYLGTGSG